MEQKLLFGALGLGIVGWLSLILLSSSRAQNPAFEGAPQASFQKLAFVLPFLIWLATLPTHAPFSSGQGWGRGFLLGGLVAALTLWGILRAISKGTERSRYAATIPLFGALIVATIPLLWMRHAVIEALLGGALGWLAVSLVWLLGLGVLKSEGQEKRSQLLPTLILNGAIFTSALLAVAALGVYRDFVYADVARGTYSAVAVSIAASIALSFLTGSLLQEISANDSAVRFATTFTLLLTLLVPLGIGFLLAMKFLDDLALFYVIAIGVVLGGLLWVLVRDEPDHSRVPVAPILVALCGFMLAYQIMQGFGVGLMLLTAFPFSVLSLPANQEDGVTKTEIAQTLSLLGSFLAILLISRLFSTRFRGDLHGTSTEDQYALFGFLGGATVPSLLASLWFEKAPAPSRSLWRLFPTAASLPRLICLGALALTLLSTMLALWGAKVVPTFLFGLALATVGFYPNFLSRVQASTVALFSLALAVTLSQWTYRFLPLAELTRVQRFHYLLWTLGGVVLLILVVDYGSRLVSWMRNRGAASAGVAR